MLPHFIAAKANHKDKDKREHSREMTHPEGAKKVRFLKHEDVVSIKPEMGTWAYERPYESPSMEAHEWSARQMHDAAEGTVHRYEPDAEIPDLKEIGKPSWAGKHEQSRYGTRTSPAKTFSDILGPDPRPKTQHPRREPPRLESGGRYHNGVARMYHQLAGGSGQPRTHIPFGGSQSYSSRHDLQVPQIRPQAPNRATSVPADRFAMPARKPVPGLHRGPESQQQQRKPIPHERYMPWPQKDIFAQPETPPTHSPSSQPARSWRNRATKFTQGLTSPAGQRASGSGVPNISQNNTAVTFKDVLADAKGKGKQAWERANDFAKSLG